VKPLVIEDYSFQIRKEGHLHRGDIIRVSRDEKGTIAILADGLGSGITANVQATLISGYLLNLIQTGLSVDVAVDASVRSLAKGRAERGPWAAFTCVCFANTGEVELFSYEAPTPLLITEKGIEGVPLTTISREGETYRKGLFTLTKGYLLVVSDGVTQAGLGIDIFPAGWGIDGLKHYLSETKLFNQSDKAQIPETIVYKAAALNGDRALDDISALVLAVR
jgi:serine phosphatase RsbU (regulator of sigma subunit)